MCVCVLDLSAALFLLYCVCVKNGCLGVSLLLGARQHDIQARLPRFLLLVAEFTRGELSQYRQLT